MTTTEDRQSTGDPTLATLLSEVVQGARDLAAAHVAQLQNEFRQQAARARTADIGMAIGLLLAGIGAIFVLVAVDLVLVEVLLWPPWVGSLVIGAILVTAGLAWFLLGRHQWSEVHFIPTRTLSSIRESFQCLTNGKKPSTSGSSRLVSH
jgi:hypothetical protein